MANILRGDVGLYNLRNDVYTKEAIDDKINEVNNYTKNKLEDIDKSIEVISKIESVQDEINEGLLHRIVELQDRADNDENIFSMFVDLYQTKEKKDTLEINSLKEKCKLYKRNMSIGFITCGIVDIVLCILIILQMYT